MEKNKIELTDYMKESMDKVAISEGFTNYKLKVDQGSAVGDGFVGKIYKVTIEEIGFFKKLDLVIKFPPDNRNAFGAMDLFQREVFVYNELFPELVKFQNEKKIDSSTGFFNFPKCYFAEFSVERNESVIIMEDLRESGYKMLSQPLPVNFEHTKLLVEALGRLHAVSFALKAQKPELFEKFRLMKDFVFEKYDAANFTGKILGNIEKAAETIDDSDSESREKVLRLKTDYFQITEELIDPDLAEPYTVVGQGDCWTNNLVYKYKNESVDRIVLLDWQNCRYCSPVLDLVNFMFGCTESSLRVKHYDELLNIYHQSLRELLDNMGGDTDSQFPFEALLDQFKRFGKYGIVMGSLIIPANSKDVEVLDMDSATDNVQLLMQISSKGGEIIKSRVRNAVIESIRLGYI